VTADHLLEVRDLHSAFPTRDGTVKAVDGVSFHLDAGETLGIVGESGCGKSVTVLSIMRLLQPPGRIDSGEVLFRGRDLTRVSSSEMEEIRGAQIAMIFQDPMTALNPVFRTGWQVGEPLHLHRRYTSARALAEAVGLLAKVGIPAAEKRAAEFPHQFSGGMRQRAMIAMGLSTAPAILIADEPTTALDVTIQAQILDLLKTVNQEFGTATILITHNLGVVAGMCRRVQVMYGGRIVEEGLTEEVFARPQHPYTWSLLRSIPRLDTPAGQKLVPIEGLPPDLAHLPEGCSFHPRCKFAEQRCIEQSPSLLPVGGESQKAACWVTQDGRELR
jgi:oligopeptide transport system ATP-binding protein